MKGGQLLARKQLNCMENAVFMAKGGCLGMTAKPCEMQLRRAEGRYGMVVVNRLLELVIFNQPS
jgi:hypothetical protein